MLYDVFCTLNCSRKIDLRCGTRMSFKQVRNPHMKNKVVTMARGRE
jgi:hypothetical protein